MEKETNEKTGSQPKIERLSTIVKPFGFDSKPIFIGWSFDGRVCSSTTEGTLSSKALRSYRDSIRVGVKVREINTRRITPLEFSTSYSPQDFIDQDKPVQDLLRFITTDNDGNQILVRASELKVLEAISDAANFWQDIGAEKMGENTIVQAKKVYTLLLPNYDTENTDVFALLFKISDKTQENEESFKRFIAESLVSLYLIDLNQPERSRKGYVETLADLLESHNNIDPGLAYFMLRDFSNLATLMGAGRLNEKVLERIKIQSANKGLIDQIMLIASTTGIVKKVEGSEATEPNLVDKLCEIPLDQLLSRVKYTYQRVRRNFSSR